MEDAFKKQYPDIVSDIELIESAGGAFEIRVDGELIYSKLETGRHAAPPEILGLFKAYIEE
ncbi:MAG: Rdx family protein [Anaerolineales bacterium]|nr:Rdx family protein [Anaerolineales bacterium]